MSASSATGGGSAGSVGMIEGIRLIAGRELAAYFDSSIAYVYSIGFIVLANAIFMNDFFLVGRAEMTAFFDRAPLLLTMFIPAVTMRLWAEERRQRTIEMLLTFPIRPMQAILGKFTAAFALYAVLLAGSLPIPIMLMVLGSPDIGAIIGGYIGLLLIGALFVSIGMCLSAVSGDQIVAFVLSAIAGCTLVLSGDPRVTAVLDGLAPGMGFGTLLHDVFSVAPRYGAFVRGILDVSAASYFAVLIGGFFWLNAFLLERIRT